MSYIELDRDKCEGHGTCEQIAPAVYHLDDEGELDVLAGSLPESLTKAAEAGARVCPVAALRVVGDQ
ncbi:ferredoxin [Rhodococcus sp. NPDC057297]|uniref:ferredoxin n=1 Tax=Rhodococcus sp. NPDC057297 TaxID=3346090 RepID=UPI00363D3FAF